MQRSILIITLLFSLLFSSISFAQDEKMKSLNDYPEDIAYLSGVTTCGVIYFNLGLYLTVTNSVIDMFDPGVKSDDITEARETIMDLWTDYNVLLEDKRYELSQRNINPAEVEYIIQNASGFTINLISRSMSQMRVDETAVPNGILKMLEETDKCDDRYLQEIN